MKIKVIANHFLKDLITLKMRNKISIKKIYNNNLIKKDNNYPVEKMILITIFLCPVQEINKDSLNKIKKKNN